MATNQQIIFLAFLAASLFYAASAIPGQATFYTEYIPSACYGFGNMGIMIAAAPRNIYNNGAACGKLYRIRCTSGAACRNGEITVRVIDLCHECANNQFDLSMQAFSRIANPAAGKINIAFSRVVTAG